MEKMHIFDHATNPDLLDTVDLMVYGDYTANLVAEHRQLAYRISQLESRVEGAPFGGYGPAMDIYIKQLIIMRMYLETMELRAEIDGIDLNDTEVIHVSDE